MVSYQPTPTVMITISSVSETSSIFDRDQCMWTSIPRAPSANVGLDDLFCAVHSGGPTVDNNYDLFDCIYDII
jgi:hypothetical protein